MGHRLKKRVGRCRAAAACACADSRCAIQLAQKLGARRRRRKRARLRHRAKARRESPLALGVLGRRQVQRVPADAGAARGESGRLGARTRRRRRRRRRRLGRRRRQQRRPPSTTRERARAGALTPSARRRPAPTLSSTRRCAPTRARCAREISRRPHLTAALRPLGARAPSLTWRGLQVLAAERSSDRSVFACLQAGAGRGKRSENAIFKPFSAARARPPPARRARRRRWGTR